MAEADAADASEDARYGVQARVDIHSHRMARGWARFDPGNLVMPPGLTFHSVWLTFPRNKVSRSRSKVDKKERYGDRSSR